MSDQQRSGSRILEDMLGETGPMQQDDDTRRGAPIEGTQPERNTSLEPQQQPRQQGGLKPLIARKRQEIIDLESKIENHEQTGAYTKKDEKGGSFFDYVAMQKDQATLVRLNRELSEMRDRDREYTSTAQNRSRTAIQMARAYLDNRLKQIPEHLRRPTEEQFAMIFKQMVGGNEFTKNQYADRAAIQAVIGQIFSTAYGEASLNSKGAKQQAKGQPADSGFDAEDDPPSGDDDGEETEDDFTNNLMYAYDRRRQGQMSIADMKRAQAAAKEANR